MSHSNARSLGQALFAATSAAIFGLALLSTGAPSLGAEAAKPARKDSNARIRPRTATLTTSVSPEAARPGQTVEYRVTAKLEPGYHIYTYSEKEAEEGPQNTKIDLFDPSGLVPEGEWAPSAPPVRKKEAVFPDLEFVEFHEDEVTWTRKLRVPDDAQPGKRTIRSQAYYQVCDDKGCSIPGRWTLPDATLTIEPAQATAPSPSASPGAEAAKPARKDSNARLRPKTVTLTTSVSPEEARPGQTIQYRVTAKLEPGYHIYTYSEKEAEEGPQNTKIDLFDPAGLAPEGEWTPSKPAVRKKEPAFPDLEFVEFYEDEVTWTRNLRVPDDATPGQRTIRSQAYYQVCDAKACSIPGRWTLPDVALTIASGGAPAAISAAPSPASPAPAASEKETTAAVPAPTPAPGGDAPAADAAKAGASKAEVSEAARKVEQGILPFLLFSALGGLSALVMPCVWPMVPITVNFFVKQGQGKGQAGGTTGLAIAYCLAIIGVFTAVGVLFSFFFSATSLQRLANNPWLNFAVAGLFLMFGLSLLGFFEIRLPNFLLNASAQGESRGGLIGVVFMAFTLTITSFTCTFPVVGGLLVMAAGGEFFYPILGMATFATVLALPFFLLALAPGLLSKMPKSGDWMNSVKVVGGLVEIGAALKFLNTAELSFVTPEDAFFDAEFVLSAWVALAAVCGLYLLGIFRTDHDYEEVKIGPGRLLCGSVFLGLALYFAPALFGRPPQSRVWYMVAGLLPPDAAEFAAPTAVAAAGGSPGASGHGTAAVSSDPETAEREQTSFHGVSWGLSLEAARERARAEGRPILIDFTGVNCPNCRTMELSVFPRPEVISRLGKFVTVQLYTDRVPIKSIEADQRKALAEKNQERLLEIIDDATNPFYVVLGPDGQILATSPFASPADFVKFLDDALAKHDGAKKVARLEPAR